ncbi:MAG: RIP metalloprotease RseP [Lachnospiraceae bacterium]|nr:RIP metalloprotease RseP [Lachnospira sp.]MBR6697391.1 RIP metalloprotease RseP [Lachnospiraceae bacterium]
MNIVLAIIILSVIIIIHEFGHFLLAKVNKVCVTEFALGMGPKLLKFKKGETEYCLKLLPFGGSCMMLGEDEESTNERAFNNKSVWARISIIAAGPIFNFILAFVFAIVIIAKTGYDPCIVDRVEAPAIEAGLQQGDKIIKINKRKIDLSREYAIYQMVYPSDTMEITYIRDGKEYKTTVTPVHIQNEVYQLGVLVNQNDVSINSVNEDSAAEKAGIKKGDKLISINGTKLEKVEDISEIINQTKDKAVPIVVNRNGEELSLTITPKVVKQDYYEDGITSYGYGVKTTPLETIKYSFKEVEYSISTVFDSFLLIFKGQVTTKDVAGPVGIVNLIGDTVEDTKEYGASTVVLTLLSLATLLSANLGVMNLLPIPALDGGRLVFLIIEAIRRKPIDREKEGMIHFIGLMVLMVLMVLILFNDIKNIFT